MKGILTGTALTLLFLVGCVRAGDGGACNGTHSNCKAGDGGDADADIKTDLEGNVGVGPGAVGNQSEDDCDDDDDDDDDDRCDKK